MLEDENVLIHELKLKICLDSTSVFIINLSSYLHFKIRYSTKNTTIEINSTTKDYLVKLQTKVFTLTVQFVYL